MEDYGLESIHGFHHIVDIVKRQTLQVGRDF
jgi:hypothetical protein